MFKKILSFFLALTTLSSTVYAIPFDKYLEGRSQYKTASYIISPGLTYTEMLSETEKYGIQRSYIYEYIPSMGTDILPLYGDYVYGRDSLGKMIEELENSGKRVAGGINGDFYIMSTGVSLSALISDGEIITSDSGYTAMGFDEEGKAFISKPEMKISLSGSEGTYEIGHLNKTPNPYSIHLLTDKFSSTTRSDEPSFEIVLAPYTDVQIIETEEEYNKIISEIEEKNGHEDSSENQDNLETDERKEQVFFITKNQIQEFYAMQKHESLQEGEIETMLDEDISQDVEPISDLSDEPDAENDTEESVDSESFPESNEFFAKKYIFSNEKITIGAEIKTVITEIRKDSKNSVVPKGHFVLVAGNMYFGHIVKNMTLGNEYVLSVSASDEWKNAVNAIGVYGGYILKDGEYCDDVEVDHYPYAHPRTAAGIKEDGTVVFYCVDGRQSSSGGMRIDELSHELKLLGCIDAVNLDGGGSTTAYATLPGRYSSELMNMPSDGAERKNANSLVFINTTEPSNKAENFTFYPEKPYIVSAGSTYILPFPSATDKNYYPVPLSAELEYEYFVDPDVTDSYITNKNELVTGQIPGETEIFIRVKNDIAAQNENHEMPEFSEYKAGSVFVLDTPEKFYLKYKKSSDEAHEEIDIENEIAISPFEQISLSFSADYHTEDIFYDKGSFSFSFPAEEFNVETIPAEEYQDTEDIVDIEDIDEDKALSSDDQENDTESEENDNITDESTIEEPEEKYFKLSANELLVSEKLTVDSDLTIKPKTHGETIEFKAKFGALEKSFNINIEKFPFNDSFSHWSAEKLFDMNKIGLMQGEPDGEELAFRPDRHLTKAEFFTVLARMLYPLIEDYEHTVSDEQFEQTPDAEIVETNEQDDLVIENQQTDSDDGNAEVEISEVAQEELSEEEIFAQMMIENREELKIFTDYDDIPEWAIKYFEVLFPSGLLGFASNTTEYGQIFLKPADFITRREVLAVLGALCDQASADFVTVFADTQSMTDDPLFSFINNAVATGIFEGYEDGTLRPMSMLTRAEAATVLLRFANMSRSL